MSGEKIKATSKFKINNFIKEESLGGILLILATIIALIWANSGFYEQYNYIWNELKMGFSIGDFTLKSSLHHWINDGLMALFFFTIGLEIKREVLAGELSSFKKASLPIFAAIGGMLVPALFYVAFNYQDPVNINGWGVPMATDIAFVLGLLSLLGNRVNVNLKIFLTALAIADDLGAILVIAFFYTESINYMDLVNGGFFLLVLMIGNRLGVRRTTFYAIVGGLGVWLSFLFSGVHATIAGVLIALTIPVRPKINEQTFIDRLGTLLDKFKKTKPNDVSLLTNKQAHLISDIENLSDEAHTPLQKLEHALHPLTMYFILPIFALSNAGIRIQGNIFDLIIHPISLGIIAGLLLGKFLGVSFFSYLAVKLRIASLPEGVTWRHIYGAGFLAGIGFTMSIFIADLAFVSQLNVEIAKVGIMVDAILAAAIGMFILSRGNKKAKV
ncbi:MAG: Na+/H+ antiporter NhaA [Bacteroidales bacterium]|nr:Na+/H+ antiporter NhaA [Bacteroidales bacterium]MCF8404222.1 Na+/H+ antiporter NhaA [Bacteroidales bacterium]